MDLNEMTAYLKRTIERSDEIASVDPVGVDAPDKRVLAIDPIDGDLFFITIMPA